MTPKELTDKAKQILAQAEARLLDKRNKELVDAIKGIKIQPNITVNAKTPDIKIPPIKIPDIKIPDYPEYPKPQINVNVPPVKVPEMEWPKGNMPIEGLVSLKGIDMGHPLPVQLRNQDGSPMKFPDILGAGGSAGRGIARIGGIDSSAWGAILTPDGRLRTDGGSGAAGGGLTDAELRAAHIDVQQLSGAMDSVVSREIPDATSTYAPSNTTVTAYASKLIVKASAGVLFSITGYNSSTSAQFIQIHNKTVDQADAVVPEVVFRVPAESSFSYSADKFGRYFSTGIVVINSSTGATLTQQAKDCWIDAQYS